LVVSIGKKWIRSQKDIKRWAVKMRKAITLIS
jgi:hypothetical protein